MEEMTIESAAEDVLLARHPILDRKQNLYGFELLFQDAGAAAQSVEERERRAAAVISNAFFDMGADAVLGKHRGFMQVTAPMLMSEFVELLPAARLVLELDARLPADPALLDRCAQLRGQGFQLALARYAGAQGKGHPLLDAVDIVKVDLAQLPDGEALRRATKAVEGKCLLADGIEQRSQTEACMQLGYQLFQGFYFARPSVLRGKRVAPGQAALTRLMSLVMSDADAGEIESLLKQNPDLSVSLLRLVNSVSAGVRTPITSVRGALLVLGRKQLQRWLQLLLFSAQANPNEVFPSPLLMLAATRGRLMELLAEALDGKDRELPERAFMTGILSLVDVLFGLPAEEVLASLPLPGETRAALLERTGRLGALLTVAERLEQIRFGALDAALAAIPALDRAQVVRCQLEAVRWTNSLCETL